MLYIETFTLLVFTSRGHSGPHSSHRRTCREGPQRSRLVQHLQLRALPVLHRYVVGDFIHQIEEPAGRVHGHENRRRSGWYGAQRFQGAGARVDHAISSKAVLHSCSTCVPHVKLVLERLVQARRFLQLLEVGVTQPLQMRYRPFFTSLVVESLAQFRGLLALEARGNSS